MIGYARSLFERHRVVFIDTNLFILLLVGLVDPTKISDFKRTRGFTVSDWRNLTALLERAHSVQVTQNVVTETDNLVRQLPDEHHRKLSGILKFLFESWIEIYKPGKEFFGSELHARFGLTDATLVRLSLEGLVLTTDVKLAGKIESVGGATFNINHLNVLR